MRATHRSYQSFDEFEREELRAGQGPSWNLDNFIEQVTVEDEEFHFVGGDDLLVGDDEDEDEDEDDDYDQDDE